MAKFIEIPYGEYNSESKKQERTQMLVNLDRVIKVAPFEQFMSKVTLAGGNVVCAFRKYDTLKAQITNRTDLMETYPDEEVNAAFEAGYLKAKGELGAKFNNSYAIQVNIFCRRAIEWFENNPLGNGWQGKFKKAMKEEKEEETATNEEDVF